MIFMLSPDPVSPQPPGDPGGGGAASSSQDTAAAPEDVKEEEVNMKEAILDDPLVGIEIAEEDGKHAIAAKPVTTPPEMTPAQRERHNLTHQPPHPGCAICRSSRSP